jgi:hypothetical protein
MNDLSLARFTAAARAATLFHFQRSDFRPLGRKQVVPACCPPVLDASVLHNNLAPPTPQMPADCPPSATLPPSRHALQRGMHTVVVTWHKLALPCCRRTKQCTRGRPGTNPKDEVREITCLQQN